MSARKRASAKSRKHQLQKTIIKNTRTPAPSAPDEQAYAVFSVGREKFCFILDDIIETIYNYNVAALPHLPETFSGVIKVKGESLPLIDLKQLLHEDDVPTEQRPCVLVLLGSAKMGFILDSDIEIVSSKQCTVYTLPDCYSTDEARFLAGIMRYNNTFVGILKPKEMMQVLAHWEEGNETI